MTFDEIGCQSGEEDNVIFVSAPSFMRHPLSASTGVFKQLDPENTGMIQLDLISVSQQPPSPDS